MCVCVCVYIRVCVSHVILDSLVFAFRVDVASFEASLSQVLLSRAMRACACLDSIQSL